MGKFIDATLRLIDNFTKPLGNAVSKMEQSAKQFQRAGKQIQKAGDSISKTGGNLTKAVSVPLVGLGVTAVKTAGDFEAAMDSVAATMGKNLKAGELDALTDKAQELGKKMKYSASDSADAFLLLAQAGWGADKMLANIEGMMYLAGATGTDLASAANYVVSAMSGLGEESGYTAEIVGNNLAKAANSSKTDIDAMGEAFSMVSTTVGQMGYKMEDALVILGSLANANYEGSEAGMAFNRIIERMSTNDTATKMLDKLGVAMYDDSGAARKLSDVFNDLRGAYAGITTDEERVAAAKALGGQYSTKLQAILGSEQGAWDNLTEAMSDTTGTCKEMYDVANDNLTGRLTTLKSTLEAIAITFGKKLMPYVEQGVGKLQKLAEWFGALSDEQVEQIIKWAGMAVVIGPVIGLFGKIVSFAGGAVSGIGKLGGSLSGLAGNAGKAKGVLATIQMPKSFSAIGNVIGKAFSGIGKLGGIATKPFAMLGKAIAGVASKSKVLGFAGKAVSKYFGGFGKIAGFVLSPFKKVLGIFGTVGKAMFTFLGPVNSVIVIIGALVAAGVLVYKNWDKISAAAGKLGGYIKSIFDACGINMDFFKEKIGVAAGKFMEFAGKAQELWTVVSPVLGKIGELFGFIFVNLLGGFIGAAIGLFGSLFSSFSDVFSGIMTILGGIIDFVTGIFTGNWEKAWSGVKDIFGGIFDSIVALAKMPINGVIGIINGAIAGINKLGFKLPDWLGGKEFKINIPQIPMLYRGTDNWGGGPAMIHDRGAEIVDLPKGTRVYPHDESIRKARKEGQKSISLQVAKLADTIIIREEADVDRIMDRFARKLEAVAGNMA